MSTEPSPPHRPRRPRRRHRPSPGSQPHLWRNFAITLLRKIIKILERTINQLEAEPQVPVSGRLWSRWLWGAILLVIFSLGLLLFSKSTPEQVANYPKEDIPAVTTSEPTEVPPTVELITQPEPEPEPLEITQPEIPNPPQEIETDRLPARLITPKAAEPVTLIVSSLTGEPYLQDSIRHRLAKLSKPYGEDLIQSVKTNFPGSLLEIQVTDKWYKLESTYQNRLGNQLFNQVRSLDFTHMEICDSDGHLLARNAVIGSDIILFNPLKGRDDNLSTTP